MEIRRVAASRVALIVALLIGLIDGSRAYGFISPAAVPTFVTGIFLTILLSYLIYLAAWTVLLRYTTQRLQPDEYALATSLAVFLILVFDIRHHFTEFRMFREVTDLILGSAVTALLVTFSAIVYFATESILQKPKLKSSVIWLAGASPLLLSEFILCYWFLKSNLSGRFYILLFVMLCFAVAIVLTIWLLKNLAKKGQAVKWSVVLTALLVIAPLPAFRIYHRPPELPAGSFSHPIRHVVLISVDTLRADALSCYDAGGVTTRNLDRLSRDSVVFRKAVSAAPWTLPSFSSIMTGVTPLIHQIFVPQLAIPEKLPTLPDYLQKAGYETAAIGNNFYLVSFFAEHFNHYRMFPLMTGHSVGAHLLSRAFPRIFPEDMSTADISDLSIEWLRKHKDKDFFLWIHFLDPHIPYTPPAKYRDSTKLVPTIGRAFSAGDYLRVREGSFAPNEKERDSIRELYRDEVAYVDDSIGQIFQEFDRLNLYDDSLIVFTSDHGEEFWEHGSIGHQHTAYWELLHVPLMIKLPGSSQKRAVQDFVTTPSVLPTILDLTKIKYDPNRFPTGSLTEFFNPEIREHKEKPILSTGLAVPEDRISVIFSGMHYIRRVISNREELYDLIHDPNERISLVESSPEKIAEGRAIVANLQKQAADYRAQYQVKNTASEYDEDEAREKMRAMGYFQ